MDLGNLYSHSLYSIKYQSDKPHRKQFFTNTHNSCIDWYYS